MEIILKYGSKARGDSDSFSDSDILVIGNIPKAIRINQLDIVRYTQNRLEKLRDMKSLFLIHLRDEGVILKDHNNWMAKFLKTIPDFTPDDDVLEVAYQNLENIVSIVPSTSGLPCWFDMLFVFLRDLLVKLNALKKHYVFAPDYLLENIDFENKSKIKRVLNLSRKIKSNYRNDVNQTVFLNPSEVSELLIKSLKLDIACIDFYELIKDPRELDPYFVLRLVEYGICTGIFQSTDNNIERYIKNPHRYSWHIKQVKWIDKIELVEPHHSPDQLQPAASTGR